MVEKGKFLDTACKPEHLRRSFSGHAECRFPVWTVLLALLFVFGCHLPKMSLIEDPLTPEEHLNLGVAYEKKGEFEGAVREYRAAAGKLPVAYLYLGNVYFQMEEYEQAETYYRKASKYEMCRADAYNNLAWLYYTRREKLDQAEALALEAISINPEKQAVYADTLEKIRGLKGR